MVDPTENLGFCDDTIPEPLNDRPATREKKDDSITPTLLDRLQNWGSD